MYLRHGTSKMKHKVIWFLEDIKDFTERKLYIFESPEGKIVTFLVEKSIDSGNLFTQRDLGEKARNIIERERCRILYTSDDIKLSKGKPCGWVYGENIEIHDRKGNVIGIKRNVCDFYGQKEPLK